MKRSFTKLPPQAPPLYQLCITSGKAVIMLLFLFIVFVSSAQAQNVLIRGKIRNENAEALPGVSIVVKGTRTGVNSNDSGNFQISVPPRATLVISSVSYTTQEVRIGNLTQLNITLASASKEMEQVVVIGYGEQRRKDVNSAISSVRGDDIKNLPVAGVDQMLQGKVAGVTVTQNSGAPGGGVSVKIRGISTFGGTEPLYVIDGVPLDGNDNKGAISAAGDGETNMSALSFLNPNDVLSIDILKDASATSIYGNRGSNGVIIITTKKGKAGEGKLSYDGWVGKSQNPYYLKLMDLKQYATYKNSISEFTGTERMAQYANLDLLGKGTDWQRNIFQNALTQNHQVALSGGKAGTTYYISGNYYNQEGTVIGSGLNRKTVRINLDNQVKPWLKLGVNATYGNTDQRITLTNNASNSYTNVIAMAIQQAPDVPIYNLDGSFGGPSDVTGLGAVSGGNPVAQARTFHTQLVRNKLQSNIYGQTSYKDFTFRSDFGSDLTWGVSDAFTPTFAWGRSRNELNTYRVQNSKNIYWNWRNTLTYRKNFNNTHDLTVLVGQEALKSTYNTVSAARSKFASNEVYSLNLGDPSTASATESMGQSTQASYFARAIYSYKNRYSVTANIRRDQTSKFAPGHQTGYFPGVSASWTASNEDFFKSIARTVSSFKVRLGYGEIGNQNVPNYSYGSALSSLFINATAFGTGLGQYVSNYGNPGVTWEHQKQTNLGVDMTIAKYFDVTVDLYDKISDKFLFANTYPAFTGIGIPNSGTFSLSAPYVNFGKMENKGLDLSIGYNNGANHKLGFRSNLVLSHYKNIVRELSSASSNISQSLSVNGNPTITRTVVGQPVGLFYGYQVEGIYQSLAELSSSAIKSGNTINAKTGTYLGDIKFRNLNKDGVIDASDRTIIGDPNPDFTYGFTNTFSYSNFDASVFITGSQGNDIFNYTRIWGEAMTATSGNQMASVANRWTPENTNTIMPRYANGDPNDNARVSDRFIEDGSYLRIQNINVGYNFTPMLSKKWKGVSRLRLYGSVQNLYTFTHYSGYDPEVGPINGNVFLNGIDLGRYPVPRTFTIGINAEL